MTDDEFLGLAYEMAEGDGDDDGEGGWTWGNPDAPGTVRHAMPGDSGILPCCGRRHEAIPRGDWMTAGADRVTCTGPEQS